ncbi:MAG: AsnC family transcriptional regulator [Candidatus Hodarchaeales archaeon]|jgi:DNA-binding Lrp family transcriptional regulator
MDSLDKSLIFELHKECRCAFSDLSNRLNISVEEVSTRVQRLVRDFIILKFTVVPSPALFGAKKAIIFFLSKQPLDLERINSLGIHPTVELISVGNGIEGFALIHYRTKSELYSVVKYFQKIGSTLDEIKAYQVQLLSGEAHNRPKTAIFELQEIDWLMLAHLREQGRLSLSDLSTRTNIAIETLIERLQFLRANNLIEETIHLNPIKSVKENWTIFRLRLTIFTEPLLKELTRELTSFPSYFSSSCWKVEEKPILLLAFLCSSYNEVEKIQSFLSETPGLISIDKTMGGTTYYFLDFRDELLEEKRSDRWFSPEKWVVNDKNKKR